MNEKEWNEGLRTTALAGMLKRGGRGLEQDPPEYYDPPGGLLSFDMLFNGLLSVAGPTSLDYALPSKQNHFELLNFQLLQVLAPIPPPSASLRVASHLSDCLTVFSSGHLSLSVFRIDVRCRID